MSDVDVAAVRAWLEAERLDIEGSDFDTVPHPAGDYVHYDDVRPLLAALDQQQREIADARAEVEHWVMRHNELERWRIQTRQRAEKAEADLAAAKAAQAQAEQERDRLLALTSILREER